MSTQPQVHQPVPKAGQPVPAGTQPAAVPVQRVQYVQQPQMQTEEEQVPEGMRIFGHSTLFYWWPVWVIGYVMAILTYVQGQQYQIGGDLAKLHPSSNLGVFFLLVLFMVILITNFSVRGLASGMVILGATLIAVVLAYFGWWDDIFAWIGDLKIHLNFGAYFWFSTLMLIVWLATVFVVDRMSYWSFKPGQVTHVFVLGTGSKSYDTNGMVLEKHREDLFRHWVLGLGSGDLQIRTSGATAETIDVPNVLFIGSRIEVMQRMIAEEPAS